MTRTIVAVLGLTGCISTQATHLAGYDPARPKTCAAVVQVYASAAAVGAPFVELAYLNTGTTDQASDKAVIDNMRVKAAELGANGILLHAIERKTGTVGIFSGAFTAKPEGKGVAIWVPRDSTGIRERCQATANR